MKQKNPPEGGVGRCGGGDGRSHDNFQHDLAKFAQYSYIGAYQGIYYGYSRQFYLNIFLVNELVNRLINN